MWFIVFLLVLLSTFVGVNKLDDDLKTGYYVTVSIIALIMVVFCMIL